MIFIYSHAKSKSAKKALKAIPRIYVCVVAQQFSLSRRRYFVSIKAWIGGFSPLRSLEYVVWPVFHTFKVANGNHARCAYTKGVKKECVRLKQGWVFWGKKKDWNFVLRKKFLFHEKSWHKKYKFLFIIIHSFFHSLVKVISLLYCDEKNMSLHGQRRAKNSGINIERTNESELFAIVH